MARCGALAQLGERLVCNQEVIGSIPIRSIETERRRTCVAVPFFRLSIRSRQPWAAAVGRRLTSRRPSVVSLITVLTKRDHFNTKELLDRITYSLHYVRDT